MVMAAATNTSTAMTLSSLPWVLHPELLRTMVGLGVELIVVLGITGDAGVLEVMDGITIDFVDVEIGAGREMVLELVVTAGGSEG